jgi:hypothetical protein
VLSFFRDYSNIVGPNYGNRYSQYQGPNNYQYYSRPRMYSSQLAQCQYPSRFDDPVQINIIVGIHNMKSKTDTKWTDKNTKLENQYREIFNALDSEFLDAMQTNVRIIIIQVYCPYGI